MRTDRIQGINTYSRQLTKEEIHLNLHRDFVGGLWEEIGMLQCNFLKSRGLRPEHYLLDVGCGALRGGIHFVEYLQTGHYYGLDINASFIEAGKTELEKEDLLDKKPHFLVSDQFEMSKFSRTFDYVLAVSVFTHLPMNHIIRCLIEVRKILALGSQFFASFFQAPSSAYLEEITHIPGNIKTNYDLDPFHYSFEELQWMAQLTGLKVKLIGEWKHPRSQQMASFSIAN